MSRPVRLIFICLLLAALGIMLFRFVQGRISIRNEVGAVGGLKTLAAQETDHYNNTKPNTFTGDLNIVGDPINPMEGPRFIDPPLTSGQKSGYRFTLLASCRQENGSLLCWSAAAWPIVYGKSGIRSFYIDENAIIRGSDLGGKPANVNIPEL